MVEKPRETEGPRPLLAEMGRHAHLGMQLALSTGLFLAVGWWLDGKVGTTPLLTIVGALVGAGAGFYSIYHHLVAEPRRRQSRTADPERREK